MENILRNFRKILDKLLFICYNKVYPKGRTTTEKKERKNNETKNKKNYFGNRRIDYAFSICNTNYFLGKYDWNAIRGKSVLNTINRFGCLARLRVVVNKLNYKRYKRGWRKSNLFFLSVLIFFDCQKSGIFKNKELLLRLVEEKLIFKN